MSAWMRLLLLVSLTAAMLQAVTAQPSFDFLPYANMTGIGGVETAVVTLQSALSVIVRGQPATFPAGSFFMFGGAQPSAVIPNSGAASAQAAAVPAAGGNWGDVGCGQRVGGDRFYIIGTAAPPATNLTGGVYYVLVSTDGVTWTQLLNAATIAAWASRDNADNCLCVVDLQQAVYSVGSSDTWRSADLGVSFTAVQLTGPRFSNRTFFAGGIYTAAAQDTIIVLGGRDAPTEEDSYGGMDHNDVWSSTTGGASWTQLTAAAAWSARDQLSWAVSSGGLMVVFGGALQGGSLGFLSDAWTSLDGVSWSLLASQTAVGAFSLCSLAFDAAGFLFVFGGQTSDYRWVDVAARSNAQLLSGISSSTASTQPTAAQPASSSSSSSFSSSSPVLAASLSSTSVPSPSSSAFPVLPPPASSSSSSISSGAIAGIVVGVAVAAVAMAAMFAVLCCRQLKSRSASTRASTEMTEEPGSGRSRQREPPSPKSEAGWSLPAVTNYHVSLQHALPVCRTMTASDSSSSSSYRAADSPLSTHATAPVLAVHSYATTVPITSLTASVLQQSVDSSGWKEEDDAEDSEATVVIIS